MTEVIINISGRKIRNWDEFKSAFKFLKEGKHLVTIKRIAKRSLSQNAYYWGVCVPMVKEGLIDAGFDEVRCNDDAHEIMKHVLLKRQMVSKQTGETFYLAGSTATITTTEFNLYLENICRWAAEYLSIVIPSPYDEFAEFKQWEKEVSHEVEI